MNVYDLVNNEAAEAQQYDGTAEGLRRVCGLKGVLPALDRIDDGGVTMLHVGEHLLMAHPGDFVVAPTRRDLSGDVYKPAEFARRFREAEGQPN